MGRVLGCVLLVCLVAGVIGKSPGKKHASHPAASALHARGTKTSANDFEQADEAEGSSTVDVRSTLTPDSASVPTVVDPVPASPAELEEEAGSYFAPQLAHFPLLARGVVEHVSGRQLAPAAADGGPRSIIVSPSYGPTSGGIWVQVMGAGSYHTPNSLQCKLDLVEQFCYSNHYYYAWCYITPKCAGVYPFHCHNGPMQFEGKYAVVAKTPWVTSVYPYSGDTSGGTPVTVRGWNFEPHCPKNLLCKFGEQVVPAKYYTSSSIMCIAPCGQEKGFVPVEVSNDGGMHWSMSGVLYAYVGDEVDLTAAQCQRYLAVSH